MITTGEYSGIKGFRNVYEKLEIEFKDDKEAEKMNWFAMQTSTPKATYRPRTALYSCLSRDSQKDYDRHALTADGHNFPFLKLWLPNLRCRDSICSQATLFLPIFHHSPCLRQTFHFFVIPPLHTLQV